MGKGTHSDGEMGQDEPGNGELGNGESSGSTSRRQRTALNPDRARNPVPQHWVEHWRQINGLFLIKYVTAGHEIESEIFDVYWP